MSDSTEKTLLVAAGFLLLAGNAVPQKNDGARATAVGLTYRRIWSGNEIPRYVGISISSDGRHLAFIQNGNVFVRDLSTGVTKRITELSDDNRASDTPVWAPDGKRLAYAARALKQIVLLNLDGTAMRTIYRGSEKLAWPRGWSPDGLRILAVTQSTQQEPGSLLWISIEDLTSKRIPTRSVPGGAASLSHDGRYVAFAGHPTGTDARVPADIHLIASNGSGETTISSGFADEYPVGWMPDGKHVLTLRGPSLWVIPVGNGQARGAPVMVQRNLGTVFHGIPSVTVLGMTRSGTFYYRTLTSTSDIYTASMDPATGKVISEPKPLPRAGFNVLPRWSPDGRRLLYHWVQWAPSDNFIHSFESAKDQRVAINVPGAAICWTDDGRSILMIPFVGGTAIYNGLTQVNLTSGESAPLSQEGESLFPASCAGDLVALYTQTGIRVRNTKTRTEREIYHFSRPTITMPSLSHDGRSVAFVGASDSGSTALFVVPSAGGPARELVTLKSPAEFQQTYFGFTWSPDNRFVYFLQRPASSSSYELFRVPAAGGLQENAGLKLADMRDIDITPDGTRIAFSLGAVGQPEVWAMEGFLSASK